LIIFVKKPVMQVFYAPDINDSNYTLGRDESRHLVKVLRCRKGSEVKLIDGKGNLYEGFLKNDLDSAAEIEITRKVEGFERRDYRIHLAVSPLKNPERYEWMLEKCVEIGIDEITPLICKNTEKKNVKDERLKNIIVSAMKQSLKASMPVLNPVREMSGFLSSKPEGKILIAHCNNAFNRVSVSSACGKSENVTILIGPEGDFAENEIKKAIDSGACSVHLGSSRLRTETAAIAACHSVYFINQ
jgi:16S rRNA (uracil1498-N3)-methyltransferase